MNIKWDAQKYSDSFSFVHHDGNDVMALIDTDKAKPVLIGCGHRNKAIFLLIGNYNLKAVISLQDKKGSLSIVGVKIPNRILK